MAVIDKTAAKAPAAVSVAAAAAPAVPAPNPAIVGLPTFIAGAVALGLTLAGYVSTASQGAALPTVLMAAGLGSLIALLWAIRLGESLVAGIYGTFTGFWFSYAALTLGLTHGWFGVAPADIQDTIKMFLIAWLVVIGLLTLATLALPWTYTLLFTLVELSLAFGLAGQLAESNTLGELGGWAILAFSALGGYLFVNACLEATGRHPLPVGRPTHR
jgi:succinate-acetate transporter protein